MRKLAFIGLAIYLILFPLSIILLLTGNLYWGATFTFLFCSLSAVFYLVRFWRAFARKKGGRVLLRAKIHLEYRLFYMTINSMYIFAGFIFLLFSKYLPLEWIILFPVILFVTGLYNLLKEVSKLEFTEEGIRQFDKYINWEQIESWSWTGSFYDYLTVNTSRFSPFRKWRIDPKYKQAVSEFLPQKVTFIQMPVRKGLRPN